MECLDVVWLPVLYIVLTTGVAQCSKNFTVKKKAKTASVTCLYECFNLSQQRLYASIELWSLIGACNNVKYWYSSGILYFENL